MIKLRIKYKGRLTNIKNKIYSDEVLKCDYCNKYYSYTNNIVKELNMNICSYCRKYFKIFEIEKIKNIINRKIFSPIGKKINFFNNKRLIYHDYKNIKNK